MSLKKALLFQSAQRSLHLVRHLFVTARSPLKVNILFKRFEHWFTFAVVIDDNVGYDNEVLHAEMRS